MKHLAKRCFSLLIVLALCLSMLPAISLSADAVTSTTQYVTGSNGYIYNWGKRGDTATYLSPNAEAFYEKNNVTYASLSALSGSSTVSSVPNSALYNELQDLMVGNHKTQTSYDETKDMYAYTDCQESGLGADGKKISSFYSGKLIGPEWDGGSTWNREHTWPKSKCAAGEKSKAATDIIMLRPTASSENSSRGNKAYGTGENYYDPNDASGDKYNLHGDVARIMLYEYVRWGETANMWGADGVMQSKDVLIEWMTEDPVDTWELGRNDSVESITGTRNVFVDYPELAFLLFGEEVPADYTTPSGQAAASAYTITATVNNAAYGSVTLSGKTITATPAAGYEVAGYTVTAGTATVTRNGNAFVVDATSDCTVRINFQPRTAANGYFYENGTATTTLNQYTGDLIQLPAAVNAAPTGFTFLGWLTTTLEETTDKPAILTVGSNYTLNGSTSFYAVYSRQAANISGTSNLFEEFSGTIVPGDYVISYTDGAMKASVTSSRFDFIGITAVDGQLLSPDASIVWTLEAASDGKYTLYNEATGKYAAATGTKNQGKLATTVDDYAKWTVTGSGTYEFVNVGNEAKGINCNLRRNANYGFACYATGTGGALTLYKRTGSTVYYSTAAAVCSHANTEPMAAVDATCEEPGYTAGVWCTDCEAIISGHTVIDALGHDYEGVVTPPTAEAEGYTTYTCGTCGDTYVGDRVPALGGSITVSFVVPQGVTAVADMSCNSAGITLPTAGTPGTEYEFVGWATESIAQTETAPTLYTGTYVAESDITLYAVYTMSVGGSSDWTMITNAADLTADMQVVIVAANANYALSTNQKSNNRGAAGVTKSGNTVTFGSDVQLLTLKAGTSAGSYAFYTGTGYLYAASTSSNHLKTKSALDANGSFTVTIDASGIATVKSVGNTSKGWMRYNPNNGNPLFACYGSGQQDIALYAVMGKTVYVSDPTVCAHENTVSVPAVDATCEEPGNTAGVYCEDCETYIEGYEYQAPLGHAYEGVVTEPTVTEGGYTTYTCGNCGDTYIDDETDPIGITYTISFVVPNGVEAIDPMGCANAGIKLPTAGTPDEQYTFLGWTEAPVTDVTEKPEILGANSRFYNNGADQTLYPVYSYVTGGTGSSGDFTLVSDAAQLVVGSKVIIASATTDHAISTTQKSSNRAAAAITKSGTTLTYGDDVQIFQLDSGTIDGTWAFLAESYLDANGAEKTNGYLYSHSGDSNRLLSGYLSDTGSFVITVNEDGSCSLVAQGTGSRKHLKYNPNNDSPLFSCYADTYEQGKAVALYVQVLDGTMYYTSLVEETENTDLVGDGEGYYETLADAIANTGAEYLFLNGTLTENVYVDCDLYLDLNGHDLIGDITVEDGCTLYLFDSATANYTADSRGTVSGTIEGDLARSFNTPESYGHNYKYLVIEEEEGVWSAHRYYLAVKSLMLSPCETENGVTGTALNYKTVLRCNDLLAEYIEGYGAKLTGTTAVYANSLDAEFVLDATGDNAVTTRLENTMRSDLTDEENTQRGEQAVTACAYLLLADGTEITSTAVTKSLKDAVEQAYGSYALTAQQRVAMELMCRVFGTAMESWNLVGPAPAGSELTVEEAIAIGNAMSHNSYTADKYKVTGMITEVYNTQYGNMKIADESGNILTIYGTYSADGETRYDALEEKPVAGDTVTILGIIGQYNGTAQIKNGWIVDFVPGEGHDAPATELTITEIIAMGTAMEHNTYTVEKYQTTGVITEVYSTTYGNMRITDDSGDILTIYGTYSADGSTRYDAMEVKPVAGDTVTILGIVGQYNGTAQIKNGWIVAHTPGEGGETPEDPDAPAEPVTSVTPVEGVAYHFGMIQEKVSATDIYYLSGGMSGYYMASSKNAAEALAVYVEATEGGYYLYCMDGETKTYINMVVSGTHVNGAYSTTASTVYTFDAATGTLIAEANGATYRFGTRNDKEYTTIGPVDVSMGNFYCKFYLAA